VTIRALGGGPKVEKVELLGGGKLTFAQSAEGLAVTLPEKRLSEIAYSLKVTGRGL